MLLRAALPALVVLLSLAAPAAAADPCSWTVEGEQPAAPDSWMPGLWLAARGDEVSGYDARVVSRSITPGFRGVTTTLVRVYTGNRFNGYVFEIVNKTKDKRLLVNIQNLMLGEPNQAILSNVDSAVLEPEKQGRNKTLLRIVAKPTSQYSKLVLPIETVEKK